MTSQINKLQSYAVGEWFTSTDEGADLCHAITGEPVASISSAGLDFADMVAHARNTGGPALAKFTFHERALMLKNLGDFNWRTRSTGSYFASIKQAYHLEDIIGTHLLKSEVCYAGAEYAKTIASFNTSKSPNYLKKYLTYYLKKPEL